MAQVVLSKTTPVDETDPDTDYMKSSVVFYDVSGVLHVECNADGLGEYAEIERDANFVGFEIDDEQARALKDYLCRYLGG